MDGPFDWEVNRDVGCILWRFLQIIKHIKSSSGKTHSSNISFDSLLYVRKLYASYLFINFWQTVQKFFKAYFKESNPMPRNGKFSFLHHAAMFWMGQTKNVNFEKTTLNMSSINEIILWNRSSFCWYFLACPIYIFMVSHIITVCVCGCKMKKYS